MMVSKLKRYLWNILITLDQLCNTLLGGDPDETMSSRMGKDIKANRCKLCKVVCYFLGLIQSDHCNKSIEPNEGSRQVTID